MGEERTSIEDLCNLDVDEGAHRSRDIDLYEKLCEQQTSDEMRDDWSESRHY